MFNIIFSYDFYIVALGVCVLAVASAMVGCFSVYKRQSLLGDAVGHSTYVGIILSFMIFRERKPLFLMIGACVSAIIAYYTINFIKKYSKIRLDSALAIVLSGFFGLGLVFDSFIQGKFSGASQAGLRDYIFGQTAYIMKEDVMVIIFFSSISIMLMILFYKDLVIRIFDRQYAQSVGCSITLIDNILLIMMILLICVGLKMVGVILVSSFLIIPCVFASNYSKNLKNVLVISSLMAVVSSFTGTLLSSIVEKLPTGPTIIVIMCVMSLISIIFGKYGIISEKRIRG